MSPVVIVVGKIYQDNQEVPGEREKGKEEEPVTVIAYQWDWKHNNNGTTHYTSLNKRPQLSKCSLFW